MVIRDFRDKLFTESFPGRTEVPKTLILPGRLACRRHCGCDAAEEFGKGNDFYQG